MKIDKQCKVELATADKDRAALANPYFTGSEVVATDGKILAVVPVKLDEDGAADKPGYIPCNVLKEARMATEKHIPESRIGMNGSITFGTRHGMCRVQRINSKLKFPDWKGVLPKVPKKRKHSVILNPKLLWQLCQALGSEESVLLEFDKQDSCTPVKVAASKSDAFGIIMPLRV